jgi:transglutaminase-like putative cysteine protease
LAEYLRPTASSPNDGIVLAKAREIVGARAAPLEKARAIYDWIVDNTFRRAEARGCGLGNIALMLESGDLASAPTSIRFSSGSRERRVCRRATSSGSGLRIRG